MSTSDRNNVVVPVGANILVQSKGFELILLSLGTGVVEYQVRRNSDPLLQTRDAILAVAVTILVVSDIC